MAYALGELGKDVRLVNSDAAPDHYFDFPGVDHIVKCSVFLHKKDTGHGGVRYQWGLSWGYIISY
jgi:hypothetical protein